jgi:hypothetical protein
MAGLAALSLVVLTGCPAPGPAADPLAAWKHKLENVTPPPSPPGPVRQVLNLAIRQAVPVVCPALTAQAAPEFKPFMTATCASIVASADPYTTTTQLLPALCAGNPPVGAKVFPQYASAITATCPLIVQLPPLLNLTSFVPLF